MLDKYLSMQEDQLREMGERKQKHQERLNSAEAMLNQLEHLRDSMELLNRQSAYSGTHQQAGTASQCR